MDKGSTSSEKGARVLIGHALAELKKKGVVRENTTTEQCTLTTIKSSYQQKKMVYLLKVNANAGGDSQDFIICDYKYAEDWLIKPILKFQQFLFNKGAPVPCVYTDLVPHKDEAGATRHFAVQEFVHGHTKRKFDTESAREIGRQIGRVHVSGQGFHEQIKSFHRHMKSESSESERKKFSLKLPEGYLHYDFHAGNLIFNEQGKVRAIIDFDRLEYGPYVDDIARAIFKSLWMHSNYNERSNPKETWVGAIGPELIRPFLQGYCEERKLTQNELSVLPDKVRQYAEGKIQRLLKSEKISAETAEKLNSQLNQLGKASFTLDTGHARG